MRLGHNGVQTVPRYQRERMHGSAFWSMKIISALSATRAAGTTSLWRSAWRTMPWLDRDRSGERESFPELPRNVSENVIRLSPVSNALFCRPMSGLVWKTSLAFPQKVSSNAICLFPFYLPSVFRWVLFLKIWWPFYMTCFLKSPKSALLWNQRALVLDLPPRSNQNELPTPALRVLNIVSSIMGEQKPPVRLKIKLQCGWLESSI